MRADLKYIIGFETNDTPVVQAAKKLDQLTKQQDYLAAAQKRGVISTAIMQKGQKQLNQEILGLRTATAQGEKALTAYMAKVQGSGKAMRQKEVAVQQAGYQLQDFIVQIQAGQNPVIAFTQQFSQLAGFFMGPWGAAIGLGIAVLGGLITALSGTGRAAKEAAKEVAEAADTMASKLRSIQAEKFTLLNPKWDADFAKASKKRVALVDELTALELQASRYGPDGEESHNIGQRNRYDARIAAKQEELDLAVAEGNVLFKNMQLDKDRTKALLDRNAQESAATNKLTKDVMGVLSGKETPEAKASRELQEYLDKLDQGYHRRAEMAGLEKEALLVQKHRNEEEDLHNSLLERGLDIGDREYLNAVQGLQLAQGEELQIYRNNAARQKALDLEKARLAELKKITPYQKMINGIAKNIGSSMENSLMSIVDGTQSVKEAFKSMALDIIKHLYKVLVVQKMVRMFGGFLGGSSNPIIASIGGGLSTYGGGFANGGQVDGGRSYLVGERGPEMFTPSMGGGHITPASQTNAGGVTIVQNINVSTGVQQTVRSEIRQMMPQIAQSAKGAVLDAKRRGGSYGSAFA